MHFSAFFENYFYKIFRLMHRSNLQNSLKVFAIFFVNFIKFSQFSLKISVFRTDFDEKFSEIRGNSAFCLDVKGM